MSKSSKLSFKLKRISKSLENFFDPLIYRGHSDTNKLFEVVEVTNAETAIFLNRLQAIFKDLMTKLEFAASGATLNKILGYKKLPEILDKYHYKIVTNAFAPFPICAEDSWMESDESNIPNNTINNIEEDTETYGLLTKLIADSPSKISEHDVGSFDGNFDECCRIMCKCDFESIDLSCESNEHRASLNTALQILMSYPELLNISNKNGNVSKACLDFLRQMKFFLEFILSNAKFTPEGQRAYQLRIRELTQQVENTKTEINDLSNQLDEQKRKNGAELENLATEVYNAMETLSLINSYFEKDVDDLKKISLENQAKSKEEFDERMENHRHTLNNLNIKIEAERASSAKEESEVQGKKFKVESQLSSIINKFDSEVGERQEVVENLMREYRALDEDRVQLIKDMEEQLIIYTSIKREREEKANAAFNKKLRKFVRNRAAKVIQRWWRVIFKNLKKKRKKGKKKGKK